MLVALLFSRRTPYMCTFVMYTSKRYPSVSRLIDKHSFYSLILECSVALWIRNTNFCRIVLVRTAGPSVLIPILRHNIIDKVIGEVVNWGEKVCLADPLANICSRKRYSRVIVFHINIYAHRRLFSNYNNQIRIR